MSELVDPLKYHTFGVKKTITEKIQKIQEL
jgi:hypothetical protein